MMKNYNIVEVHWKARFSGGGGGGGGGGGVHEKRIYKGRIA